MTSVGSMWTLEGTIDFGGKDRGFDRFRFFGSHICVCYYLASVCLFYGFFEFLVHFLLFVLCCQYQCK